MIVRAKGSLLLVCRTFFFFFQPLFSAFGRHSPSMETACVVGGNFRGNFPFFKACLLLEVEMKKKVRFSTLIFVLSGKRRWRALFIFSDEQTCMRLVTAASVQRMMHPTFKGGRKEESHSVLGLRDFKKAWLHWWCEQKNWAWRMKTHALLLRMQQNFF